MHVVVVLTGKLAAETFVKVADCHKSLESIHEMTTAYVEAAHCYKKIDVEGATQPSRSNHQRTARCRRHQPCALGPHCCGW